MADDFVYDVTNEMLVIGAAIADSDIRKRLVRQLSSDEFFDPKHPPIFSALRDMVDRALEYEYETALRLLQNETDDDAVAERLKKIEENAKVPDNLEWIVNTFKWDAQRAMAYQNLVPKLIKTLKDPKAESTDVQSVTKSILRATESTNGVKHLYKDTELQRNYKNEIEQRRSDQKFYPLGWEAFDKCLTEGFKPKRMTVLAGLSSAGKSTVCAIWALRLALQEKRRVLYCPWEMEVTGVVDVMCSHLTKIPLRQIIQGKLNYDEAEKVCKASETVTKNIQFMGFPFIDDIRKGNKPSNDRNLQILEYHIAESGADVAVFDIWERMLRQKKPEEVELALHWMQDMLKEYSVHGIIVHQLRLKDVEQREDKRPTRESIKGTAAYVEVPDMVFGVHRRGQFKNIPDSTVETINLKQRSGESFWDIEWDWHPSICGLNNPRQIDYDPGLENESNKDKISSIKEDKDTIFFGGKWDR